MGGHMKKWSATAGELKPQSYCSHWHFFSFFLVHESATNTQNHKITQTGGTSGSHLIQHTCSEEAQLAWVAKGHVQAGF